MKDVHIVVGVLALALNLFAFAIGAVAWFRRRPSNLFWRALRAGQATVADTVRQGAPQRPPRARRGRGGPQLGAERERGR